MSKSKLLKYEHISAGYKEVMKSEGIKAILQEKAEKVANRAREIESGSTRLAKGVIGFNAGKAANGSVRAHANVSLTGLVKKEKDITALQRALFSAND